jgi:hypothetical protein
VEKGTLVILGHNNFVIGAGLLVFGAGLSPIRIQLLDTNPKPT